MLKSFNKIALFSLCVGIISVSCEKDTEVEEVMVSGSPVMNASHSILNVDAKAAINPDLAVNPVTYDGHNLRNDVFKKNAVEPTDCSPTAFNSEINKVIQPFFSDPLALTYFDLYLDLNFYISYLDTSEQYFGENGEYTNFMAKRVRDLERFWDMPNEIRVNGQHTASLNDRDKLASVYIFVGLSSEVAYANADFLLSVNEASPVLPESPYFAMDGFATAGNLIVIGDGITSVLSRTGIDEGIVWTGILAHEWAHQIQFDNYSVWYPEGAADNQPEATRYTELEADFMAAYYMTHKRGATYNWKRVVQFYELFFNIGDCGFDANGHHGTPQQRMEAARLGYELANDAQKQGHILTEQELHEIFVSEVIDAVVAPEVGPEFVTE
ncbi:hypothetical protein [Salinimicrobium sediminilitoris]|uniref:hypothetical protein n=1 Tax=Salinimicrobium sediminilitoris TaxID=2876715 RepID=UPI001E5076BA|nr:hypothetical protein [Salinimicrobium sediminilitoris]MCC8358969.1 hypothetical protein [Salinimicrobium sediminilitoris]